MGDLDSKQIEQCGTCYFFLPIDRTPKHGYCRRYPPKVVLELDWAAMDDGETTDWHVIWQATQQPAVESDDWCGEWRSP